MNYHVDKVHTKECTIRSTVALRRGEHRLYHWN